MGRLDAKDIKTGFHVGGQKTKKIRQTQGLVRTRRVTWPAPPTDSTADNNETVASEFSRFG